MRLDSLRGLAPGAVLSSLVALLAESPDPDWTLNQLDRWLARSPEIISLFEQHPPLLHYAVATLGHSRYLGETLLQNPDLLPGFLREDCLQRSRSRDEFHEAWARFRARSLTPTAEPDIAWLLARFKRREYVRILLRDVLHRATLADITGEISALSDVLIEEALREATSKLNKKYGPAQHLDEKGRAVPTPFAVLALGKLGGNELNYSSDVDLVYVYGEEKTRPGAAISNREYFVRLAQEITQTLSRVTQEGPVFRIDMRLRPQGAEGELALARRQMLSYYSETAQDWELQALIKVRYSAGDEALARECLRGVQPFVYRGAAGSSTAGDAGERFAAIETVLQARERLVAKRRPSPVATSTIDVKLDRGGIRDIEFLVQCLQRVHGGREVWLRSRGTLFALQKLHDKDHLSGHDFQELTSAYEFFRQVEHRLQLRMGQQTHKLPSLPEELRSIERAMAGHPLLQHSSQRLEEVLQERMTVVSEIYRRIIHHQQWRQQEENEQSGFELSARREAVGELPYQVMLDRLAQDSPQIFAAAQDAEAGSLRRRNLQRFLSAVFTSSARYAFLLRHPEALAPAMQVFDTSGFLTDVLVQYPEECATLTAMGGWQTREGLSGYLFTPPSRWEAATADPVFQFVATANTTDAEKLALLRRHYRHLSFVAGVRDLMELRPVYQSLSEHSAAADDVIRAAFTLAGQPQGLAVLALGRLGAAEFDVFSDADLLFARDESLPHQAAQKAVEQIVHALAAYTREGMVFPVDVRLRPRGSQGELVLTPAGFAAYCRGEAQSWEALTYTKLRFLCGSTSVGQEVSRAIEGSMTRFQDDPGFAASVNEIRSRLDQIDPDANWKSSAGGIYDVDFLTGFLLLKGRLAKRDGSLRDRLWRLAEAGLLTKAEAGDLDHAAELLRTADHVASLVTGRAQKWLPSAEHALAATERWASEILRRTFPGGLADALEEAMGRVREIYRRKLQ
jgi:glutamate-ammonia-ligase adenylyltransferase